MSKTKIEWADLAHNVVDGCSPASPGCTNCYAARLAAGRMKHRPAIIGGLVTQLGTRADLVEPGKRIDDPTKSRPVYNGIVALNHEKLVAGMRLPSPRGGGVRTVFWNHYSDTFHEGLTFAEIGAQFAVMAARQDLRFFVLTKRPERAQEFLDWIRTVAIHDDRCGYGSALVQCYREATGHPFVARRRGRLHVPIGDTSDAAMWPLPNVAIGVSAEDQRRWDERVSVLLEIPAAMRFVSAEPLLGSIDPTIRLARDGRHGWVSSRVNGWGRLIDPLNGRMWVDCKDNGRGRCVGRERKCAALDQVIIGAESGPGARPMDLEWAQDLAREVLDAQRLCEECPDDAVPRERYGCTGCGGRRKVGPSLFVKQADVCAGCAGEGKRWQAGRWSAEAPCSVCDGSMVAGKVRKDTPELWIPGHGSGPWAQMPTGWA